MSAAGRWFITPHSCRQYIARARREATFDQALTDLIQLAEMAHRVKELQPGVELWRTGKPLRLRLIVSHRGVGEKAALVTVLRGCDKVQRAGREREGGEPVAPQAGDAGLPLFAGLAP